ncbi:unnamed protein product, partial [Adineta steineri]
AAVGAIAMLAVGTTIGAPTYGTYRLVKHIRSKRQDRRRRQYMETISRQWTTSDSLSTYINTIDERNTEIDDIEKAIQASLITYRNEISKRENKEMLHHIQLDVLVIQNHHDNNDNDDEDDDDDSFDD